MDLDDRIQVKGQDFTGDHVTQEETTLTISDRYSPNTIVFPFPGSEIRRRRCAARDRLRPAPQA